MQRQNAGRPVTLVRIVLLRPGPVTQLPLTRRAQVLSESLFTSTPVIMSVCMRQEAAGSLAQLA
jgi:hypothetical protein